MLDKKFTEVYDKFKLNLYKNMFHNLQGREATLTATETFTVEVINMLNRPRVSDLTEFLEMSHPNIAYKIASLIKKGYVNKVQSEEDKREFYLEVTDKFYKYYEMKEKYLSLVLDRLNEKITPEEAQNLEKILSIMSDELMPEVTDFMNKIKDRENK